MASPAQAIRQYLVDQGLVLIPAPGQIPYEQLPGDGTTLCYVSGMPDDVDQAVCIKDGSGRVFGKRQRDGKIRTHPGLRFLVRTLDYTGYDLANEIATVLDRMTLATVVIGGVSHYIQSVYRTTNIVPVGEEVGKQRQEWTWYARVAFQDREPSLG